MNDIGARLHDEQLKKARILMAQNASEKDIAIELHMTPKNARKLIETIQKEREAKKADKEPEHRPGAVYYISAGSRGGYWWQEGYWEEKRNGRRFNKQTGSR